MATEPVRLRHLPYDTDGGIGTGARLGLIALATDFTIEHDFRTVLAHVPDGAVYVSRIPMAADVTPDSLAAMERGIGPATALILPGAPLDAVAYGCTSATAVLGAARVAELIRAEKPGAAVTEPISAATTALRALGARRIGVLTPYTAAVNETVEASLAAGGFEVAAFGSFDEPHDPTVAAISPEAIARAAETVARAAAIDALFISCTNLRAFDLVGRLEAALDLPVTTSNHALAWHARNLAGVAGPLPLGRLFGLAPRPAGAPA